MTQKKLSDMTFLEARRMQAKMNRRDRKIKVIKFRTAQARMFQRAKTDYLYALVNRMEHLFEGEIPKNEAGEDMVILRPFGPNGPAVVMPPGFKPSFDLEDVIRPVAQPQAFPLGISGAEDLKNWSDRLNKLGGDKDKLH